MKKDYVNIQLTLFKEYPNLNPLEIIIIARLIGYQKRKLYCYESQKELAEILNVDVRTFKRTIKKLRELKLIFLSQDRKHIVAFGNKKAIIFVDENNPHPCIENITPIPEVIVEIPFTSTSVRKKKEIIEN